MDYVSNTVDKLVLIQDSMILSTVNSDVKNFCVYLNGNVLFVSWIEYVYDEMNICEPDSVRVMAQSWNLTLKDKTDFI